MSDGPDLPGWEKRVLDYVGLGFLLLVAEELWRRPKVWYSWGGALVLGGILLWLGDAGPIAWKWLLDRWRAPKKLATALAENAALKLTVSRTFEEFIELREKLNLPAREPLTLPAPTQDRLVKPRHNVQFVEFTVFDNDDFVAATFGFQNRPNGKLLGKFQMPSVRALYYHKSTGQELADLSPLSWWNASGDPPMDIGPQKEYALVASFFRVSGVWTASETYTDEFDLSLKLHSVELPAGDIHVIASLTGVAGLWIGKVEGILTLSEDGTASFQQMHN